MHQTFFDSPKDIIILGAFSTLFRLLCIKMISKCQKSEMVHGFMKGLRAVISRGVGIEKALLIENIVNRKLEMCLSMQKSPVYVRIPNKARAIHDRKNVTMIASNLKIGFKRPIRYFIASCEVYEIGTQAIVIVKSLSIVPITITIISRKL